EGVGAQELDARGLLAADDELLDLVDQAADARLLELLAAQRLGLADADAADARDRLAAGGPAPRPRAPRRGPPPRPGRGGGGRRARAPVAVAGGGAASHVRQDLLDHVADQLVGDLQGVLPVRSGERGALAP